MPDYTPEERQQLKADFAPIAARYRRHRRIGIGMFVGGWIVVFIAVLLTTPDQTPIGFIVTGFLTAAAGPWLEFLANFRLRCTGCHWRLHSHELGTFCPECGGSGLRRTDGPWWRAWQCDTCGRKLRFRNRRLTYKVHYCSQCGLHLDEKGL